MTCEPTSRAIFIDEDGAKYALNGVAIDQTDYPSIDSLRADNPNGVGTKIDLAPLIAQAC